MAGRHEPESHASFYLSLATAVLRAGLVVAAIALGFFVLSKAFPDGDQAAGPTTPGSDVQESPSVVPTSPVTESPAGGGGNGGGGGTEEPRDPSEVQLQILNGTDVAGLADETRQILEAAGYKVLTIGNASGGPYETTVISYLKKARADAEVLAEQYFPNAQLEPAAPNTQIEISVILGDDYAAQQEAAGGETEESPAT